MRHADARTVQPLCSELRCDRRQAGELRVEATQVCAAGRPRVRRLLRHVALQPLPPAQLRTSVDETHGVTSGFEPIHE